jgi:hypothetical protein
MVSSTYRNLFPKDAAIAPGGFGSWKQLGPEVQWHHSSETFFPGKVASMMETFCKWKVALANGNFL